MDEGIGVQRGSSEFGFSSGFTRDYGLSRVIGSRLSCKSMREWLSRGRWNMNGVHPSRIRLERVGVEQEMGRFGVWLSICGVLIAERPRELDSRGECTLTVSAAQDEPENEQGKKPGEAAGEGSGAKFEVVEFAVHIQWCSNIALAVRSERSLGLISKSAASTCSALRLWLIKSKGSADSFWSSSV